MAALILKVTLTRQISISWIITTGVEVKITAPHFLCMVHAIPAWVGPSWLLSVTGRFTET